MTKTVIFIIFSHVENGIILNIKNLPQKKFKLSWYPSDKLGNFCFYRFSDISDCFKNGANSKLWKIKNWSQKLNAYCFEILSSKTLKIYFSKFPRIPILNFKQDIIGNNQKYTYCYVYKKITYCYCCKQTSKILKFKSCVSHKITLIKSFIMRC